MESIIDLIDGYESLAARAAKLAWPHGVRGLAAQLQQAAVDDLARIPSERLDKLAVYFADKYYRIFNQLSAFDARMVPVLEGIGAAVSACLRQRGRPIAYLVDNQLADDRIPPLPVFFGGLGFAVAVPEWFGAQLAGAGAGQPPPETVVAEAKMLSRRVVTEALAGKQNVLVASGQYDLGELQEIGRAATTAGYVVTFRNDAPVDGSNIDIWS